MPSQLVSRSARAFAVVGLTTAYCSYVFQVASGRPLTDGLGGWLDSYFINALLEHWYFSIVRLDNPVSPPMFFPAAGTLGYSHGLILFAPFYLSVRPFVDAFLAHTFTIFLVIEIGSISLYLLMRRLGLGFWESIAFTALFVTSANVINGGIGAWSQRASVFLIPPIALLVYSAAVLRHQYGRIIMAALGGLLATSMFTQDFYTAALAVVTIGLLFPAFIDRPWLAHRAPAGTPPLPRARPHVVWLVVGLTLWLSAILITLVPIDRFDVAGIAISARDPSRPLVLAALCLGWYAERRWRPVGSSISRLRAADRSVWQLACALGVGAVLGACFFIWAYAGSFLEHNAFPADHLWIQLRRPTLEWNDTVSIIRDVIVYESSRTFAIVFLLMLLALVPRLGVSRVQRARLIWLAIITVVIVAIPLRTEELSVWKLTLGWLPGLSAVRDPKRIIYLYELGAVLALAVIVSREPRRSPFRVIALGLAMVSIAYAWNGRVFEYERSREQFHRWVSAPIAIDPSCRSFFTRPASVSYMSRSDNMYGLYATDALFVALRVRLPTLNGYSAWVPPEYHMLHPNDAPYLDHVKSWIDRNQLAGVCALDMDARTMTPFRE